MDSKSFASSKVTFSLLQLTTACAKGCYTDSTKQSFATSLPLYFQSKDFSTEGFPSVIVPVLSVIRTLTLFMFLRLQFFYQHSGLGSYPSYHY
jgi:hypothetical protein